MNQEQNEQWHYLYPEDDDHDSQGAVKGVAPQASPWFSGHFPGNPILPGIAILVMVKETILCGEGKKGKKVKITGMKKIRFRLPAKPDDTLDISYSALPGKENLTYSFKVSLAGQVMCMGAMLAAEAMNL
ncbi:MAG: hypothetical protein LBV07_00945 [Syntrophobacterales bacterium]|jgi:3-hydroxymyristoyl/3-hydroxydecanoyl-(acyl carrier protein) dehydratase|nr:hypothetical protein [Syntrophobacterales bacterium]